MTEWISSSDALPTESGTYLVCNTRKSISERAEHVLGKDFMPPKIQMCDFFSAPEPMWKPRFIREVANVACGFEVRDIPIPRTDITHWMPLPNLPEALS